MDGVSTARVAAGKSAWKGRCHRGVVPTVNDEDGTVRGSVRQVPDQTREDRFREQVLPELEVCYRVARRLTRTPTEAEDLVQDALLRAFRGFDAFDGRYPRAWLLTIVRNTHYNRLRKRQPDLLDDEVAQRLPARGADGRQDGTADQAFENQFDPLVRAALASLSANHRAVIALVDLDELTYQEAADVLGIPAGTVMSRLHRARRKVRTYLEEAGFTEVER
jgi:RNA polymerase sigma-70 factor, ECF subfamily